MREHMRQALEDLIEAVDAAINAGDWKVDGACEPTLALIRAKRALEQTKQCEYPRCACDNKESCKHGVQSKPDIEIMRQMLEVQGQHGNWNYDPYMQGLYNGMEYMVALVEKREPKFRDAPEIWLAKYEVKRDNFNSTEPLTEATNKIKE